MFTHRSIHAHIHLHKHTHVRMHVHVHMHMHIQDMYIHRYVFIFAYTYIFEFQNGHLAFVARKSNLHHEQPAQSPGHVGVNSDLFSQPHPHMDPPHPIRD